MHLGFARLTLFALVTATVLTYEHSRCVVFAQSISNAANKVSTNSRDGRLIVFDDVWSTIRQRYYDPELHGIDWEAMRAEKRALAADARDSKQFYVILRQMVGSLHDAHTRLFAPEENIDWEHPRFIGVGLTLREVAGQPVVVAVESNSDAERAGLKPGDILTSVDDEPALNLFARRMEELGGSSTIAAARLRAMTSLFAGESDASVRISWIASDRKHRSATLKRKWSEKDLLLRVRKTGDYAIVDFDAFTPQIAVDFSKLVPDKFSGVRGLVIDLRNNGGGDLEAMVEIASAFLPQGTNLGNFFDRTARVEVEPRTRTKLIYSANSVTPFNAPVVILISERTSSAAEIFTAALREARRASVVGTNSCGCVLAVRRRHILPDNGALDVSELDYRTGLGTRLEGVGITPDIKVVVELSDLSARNDRAMNQALEQLRTVASSH